MSEKITPVKMAALVISQRTLCELLQLPPGAEIAAVRERFEQPGVFEFRIKGAGWDTPEGHVIRTTWGMLSEHHNADGDITHRTLDWGLPDRGN